ncbi:Pleiotropic negative transcriptional regulator [Cichlidogyrus casuarinus]|uniref:Pleiotropic negative transcriptional regulator n=1 Tax=Cichlidogyrus casuarinus TaxID=1844966 RepID=A0ABD2PU73_9PLAT
MPLQFDMFFRKPYEFTEKQTSLGCNWPTIFFEVSSSDSLGRHRTEGYAWTELPYNVGCSMVQLQSWYPTGDSFTNQLRRYFIGGTPQLEDYQFLGPKNAYEDKKLSRYGFRTTPAGQLFLRFNCMHQSRECAEVFLLKKSDHFSSFGHKERHFDIISVLSQLFALPLYSQLQRLSKRPERNSGRPNADLTRRMTKLL